MRDEGVAGGDHDHQANGMAELGVHEIKGQVRVLLSQLEERLGRRLGHEEPLHAWLPRHAANCINRHCQVSELCIIEVTAPGDFHQVGPWDLFDDSKERRQWGVGDVEDPRAFHVQVEPLIAHLDLEITGPSIGRRQFVGDVAAGAQQTSGDPGLGQRAVEWFGGIDGALQPGSNGLSRSATAAGETTPCGQFRPNVLLESSVAWLS